jgi:hypothetical protein
MGQPVQIVIPSGVTWGNVNFRFRVPTIPGETSGIISGSNSGIILWTFGYSGASLYASGETQIFKMNEVTNTDRKIDTFSGLTNTGVTSTFGAFYNNY